VTPLPVSVESDGKVRLNKFLAAAGICSRRAADDLIAGGRVTVNRESVRELGLRIDPSADEVMVDGERVSEERKVYVLFNKPTGVVCTNARHEQKPRVIDFLESVRGRIYTVGRLDVDSEGLILLTNDGDFAQELAHPRFGVPKTYAVLVRGVVESDAVGKARGGVWLAEGRTGGAQIKVERRSRDRTYLKVTIREGKNREVRRVFAKLGHPVVSLKRVRIGQLTLHGLKAGQHRFLRPEEVQGLRALAREASP
jgi:pseudouridine synthase